MNANVLVKNSIATAVDIAIKEREKFAKKKNEVHDTVVNNIIKHLGETITKYPNEPSKWTVEALLDRNDILNQIDNMKWFISKMNMEYNNDHVAAIKRGLKQLQYDKDKLKYIDIDELASRLDLLGYKLVETRVTKKFLCVTYSDRIIYNVYIK